ncbi:MULTISPECIES: N-acetylneuraminate synthase family protein [Cohnella]|jgi:N-acetylneuraminate synthase|uniref:N-acetylneuraminate synthase family protein n=1 Tax=Cohnella TaxID=329857 RepID=UPI00035D3DB3|nr:MULTISPECIES: N-acetylneuraminate synthase family protein [Cohnella]REK63606.1 MAG: N-acetylneuraminate synthase [Cohnella sp.]
MASLQSFFTEKKCLVAAEIAQAHDGSLGTAHALIDAAADAGADAVKFQTHIAEEESTPQEPWRVQFSRQDATRYDYWKRMEFTKEQWKGLKEHAEQRGLIFFSSPFSPLAVDWLEELDVPFWKVASGEIANKPLIDRMTRTGKPILVSTGLCTLEELDACVGWLQAAGSEYLVFQCTSEYPCPPEKVGLNLLPFYRDRYGCPVGLSDHSGEIYPGLAAALMGASMIEVHVTFSKQAFGPDVPASLTMEQLKLLTDGVSFMEKMLAHPIDKEAAAYRYRDMRAIFYRSLVAREDLPAGTVLQEGMIAAKKPGGGIPPSRLGDLIGKTLRHGVAANHPFRESDFEADEGGSAR